MTRYARPERIRHLKEKYYSRLSKAFVILMFAAIFIALVLISVEGFKAGNWLQGIIAVILIFAEFILGMFFIDLVWHEGD